MSTMFASFSKCFRQNFYKLQKKFGWYVEQRMLNDPVYDLLWLAYSKGLSILV